MSFFVTATTPAPEPKTKNVRIIGMLAAGIIGAMAVAQLFTFENFPAVIASMWLPGGETMARVSAAFIVIAEVLALPFLLSMRLSPLFRLVSMVLGWIVVVKWLFFAIWENIMVTSVTNNGMFGATVPLPVGWWNVFFSLGLAILIVWVSWGMWPKMKKSGKGIVSRKN